MKAWFRIPMLLAASVTLAMLVAPPAHSTSMLPQNVVDLVSLSDRILVGEVVSLSDGIDGNLPYTEVTLRVSDAIVGDPGSVYTFRQFGLIEPKRMPNGLTNLQVTPDGWPVFAQGEQVMVFLYKQAEISGFQTTVGLFQGKFDIVGDEIVNGVRNMNLFHNVDFDLASLSNGERRLVSQRSGSLPASEFISLVRKAVSENWVEQGRMIHAQQ